MKMLRTLKNNGGIHAIFLFILLIVVGFLCSYSLKIDLQIKTTSERSPGLTEIHQLFEADYTKFKSRFNKSKNALLAQTLLLSNLEEHVKRVNIRIHGVPETPNENIRQVVEIIFNETLQYPLNSDAIDRIVRLETSQSPPRPVVVTFALWSDRKEILQRSRLLPSHLELSEDFSELYDKMQQIATKSKDAGKNVNWKRKKLFIDGIELKPEFVFSIYD